MQRDIGKPLFDLLLVVASAAAFAVSMTLPNIEIVGDLSPAFFPMLISALVFLFAVPCLIKDFREWQAAGTDGERTGAPRGVAQWLLIVALALVYILIFERLGYIVSTAIFVFACVVGLLLTGGTWRELTNARRAKSLAGAAVFAAVLAVVIFYVFTELFEIPLPG
ncbi:tripartite tricarboxylate transporter TctB family protein [Kushneria indalinina]|uniref:Tripartite tricarboxylate transporter TctB family protein n=1 Tax=Kushneria indalinina DSM 14324 TaxID=1122140 RepID=A0A3D9E0B0_9GAMM|nr:tripartite tricarboxylate transporter TctB family protein [Kushneria indalinina]REC96467.1 tripartite tricarboxylate transporter TctB family protein [Kushneria indalinina DSM 14324]